MATHTLNQEGAVAPSKFELQQAVVSLLRLQAEQQLERDNPELYYAPPRDNHVVTRDLRAADERRRLAHWEANEVEYEARVARWRTMRELAVAHRVQELFEHYAAVSRKRLWYRDERVPADLRRWIKRQLQRGAMDNTVARVFLYLTVAECYLHAAFTGVREEAEPDPRTAQERLEFTLLQEYNGRASLRGLGAPEPADPVDPAGGAVVVLHRGQFHTVHEERYVSA